MTASDESFPATAGSSVPGEIDALEQYVRHQLHKLENLPYATRPFWEETAFRRQRAEFLEAAKAAAANLRLDWPPDEDVALALGHTSLVTGDGGTVDFASTAVADYLAACHIVRQQPGGRGRWQPFSRKHLAPQPRWPWRDHKVLAFVAGRWWENAESAVRRDLSTLLSRRHRDPNVHFVAELLRRDLVRAEDLREATVEILRQHLTDGGRPTAAFTTTAAALHSLEPDLTMTDLEHLVRSPDKSVDDSRRLDAVDVLSHHDPARGARGLVVLATTPTDPPRERLDVLTRIRERDWAVGDEAILRYATDPDMGDLQVDAEVLIGDPTRWPARITGDRGLTVDGRLRLLAALGEHDTTAAASAAEHLARNTTEPTTRVRIARAIWPFDRDTGLRIAEEVAWPTRRGTADEVRRSAVDLIGEIDPERALPELERFARDTRTVGMKPRFRAAMDVVERGGRPNVLVEFAESGSNDLSYRVEAARRIGREYRDVGCRLFISFAKSCSPADPEQLRFLREAYGLVPRSAAEAMKDVAKDGSRPMPIRVDAVELAHLDRRESVALYKLMATSARDREDAFLAADRVLGPAPAAGQEFMAELARRFGGDVRSQLRALRKAGVHGKPVLRRLAKQALSDKDLLEVAQLLRPLDRRAGEEALTRLVRKRRAGEIRIEAALALTRPLPALAHIVRDPGDERIRFQAGVRAAGIDQRTGRELLVELAAAPGVSTRTRQAIRQHLGA